MLRLPKESMAIAGTTDRKLHVEKESCAATVDVTKGDSVPLRAPTSRARKLTKHAIEFSGRDVPEHDRGIATAGRKRESIRREGQ